MELEKDQSFVILLAQISEKSYRRGFHQGFLSGLGEIGDGTATPNNVRDWRFKEIRLGEALAPPGLGPNLLGLIERLGAENREALKEIYEQLLYGSE